MVNFSDSQYSLCSVFYKVKTFLICAICSEKGIYLVCRQTSQELVWVVSAGIQFSYILHWYCQVRALFSLWMSLAPFVAIADGKRGFLWTMNMDLFLHKSEFIRGVLVTKKKLVKNYAILDINLCSIKLPELCEFDQKKSTCRITLTSLFIKLKHPIFFLQLILHFRSVARIITQFLSPLASLGLNLGRREAFICQGMSKGIRVYRDNNYKFCITTFIWLTICIQTERCCIICSFSQIFLVLFCFNKRFFNSVLSSW